MEASEQQLWSDYRNGVTAAREHLLEKYMPFAKRLAAALYAKRATNGVDFGDYLHLAYIGLMEAMQNYRHDADAQFTTFASYRIRGSVLNGVPRMTEVGDQVDFRRRQQRDRTDSLLGAKKEPPSSLADLLELVVGIALSYQLDELVEAGESDLQGGGEPYGSRAYDEMQQRMKEVLLSLPERERKIIQYHYFHQVSFNEIAALLEITKSRVSQLHKRALELIREALRKSRLTEFY